ncbi:hypothetical protein ACA910_001886 [Epithemia clementina (nom. ined.)]
MDDEESAVETKDSCLHVGSNGRQTTAPPNGQLEVVRNLWSAYEGANLVARSDNSSPTQQQLLLLPSGIRLASAHFDFLKNELTKLDQTMILPPTKIVISSNITFAKESQLSLLTFLKEFTVLILQGTEDEHDDEGPSSRMTLLDGFDSLITCLCQDSPWNSTTVVDATISSSHGVSWELKELVLHGAAAGQLFGQTMVSCYSQPSFFSLHISDCQVDAAFFESFGAACAMQPPCQFTFEYIHRVDAVSSALVPLFNLWERNKNGPQSIQLKRIPLVAATLRSLAALLQQQWQDYLLDSTCFCRMVHSLSIERSFVASPIILPEEWHAFFNAVNHIPSLNFSASVIPLHRMISGRMEERLLKRDDYRKIGLSERIFAYSLMLDNHGSEDLVKLQQLFQNLLHDRRCLKVLDLTGCGVTDSAALVLFTVLKKQHNTSLQKLDLRENALTLCNGVVGTVWMDLLPYLHCVCELHLPNNFLVYFAIGRRIKPFGHWSRLIKALQLNTSLTKLSIDSAEIHLNDHSKHSNEKKLYLQLMPVIIAITDRNNGIALVRKALRAGSCYKGEDTDLLLSTSKTLRARTLEEAFGVRAGVLSFLLDYISGNPCAIYLLLHGIVSKNI